MAMTLTPSLTYDAYGDLDGRVRLVLIDEDGRTVLDVAECELSEDIIEDIMITFEETYGSFELSEDSGELGMAEYVFLELSNQAEEEGLV